MSVLSMSVRPPSTLDPGSKQILNTCLLHRGLNFTGVHKGRQDTGYSIVKRLLGLGTGDLDWGLGSDNKVPLVLRMIPFTHPAQKMTRWTATKTN